MQTHFKTTPRQARNRTGCNILKRNHKLLEEKADAIEAWSKTGKGGFRSSKRR